MPPIAKHNPGKQFFFRAMAGLERPFRSRPSLAPDSLRSIRNFLFLQYDKPLGSAVHSTPLFEAIRNTIPNAHISVAASPMAASVLVHNPYIDSCVVTLDPWQDFRGAVRAVRQIVRLLPPGPICLATTLGNQRSRLAFLAMLAGKTVRTGYMLATPLFDLPLIFRAQYSQIEANLDILRILGHNVTAPEPRIFFDRDDVEYAIAALSQTSGDETKPRIVYVTQNSGAQPNQWRSERFQQVIDTLTRTFDSPPIFVGSAQEAQNIDALRQSLQQKGISLAGTTTIPQLAAVLALCDAVVSLDTGSFHVARAVQLPGVVIAPGWQNPIEWLPISQANYRVLWGGPIPEETADRFIDEITVEQVIGATEELLSIYPPSISARRARLQRAHCDNEFAPTARKNTYAWEA